MAITRTDPAGMTHLLRDNAALCNPEIELHGDVDCNGVLSCPTCAKVALDAIALSTKQERRAWRKL